ncbi:hypothetical protein JM47_01465 [Ureaplasma diversum]|uniref:Uncharacterized protein n=1 Tax=Ureaplasma diversum TaxID=42094 RepID=A0A0C5RBN4_9BACT|nr:hypothetical protein [Ureaplasma diversum]AJQ45281.1 hypothetical protein JM47_01465 [Ureaplasma diversum]
MLIQPNNKKNEKIYEIKAIEADLVILENDIGDRKEIQTYEFDTQGIIPELGMLINLLDYNKTCSVFEIYEE